MEKKIFEDLVHAFDEGNSSKVIMNCERLALVYRCRLTLENLVKEYEQKEENPK